MRSLENVGEIFEIILFSTLKIPYQNIKFLHICIYMIHITSIYTFLHTVYGNLISDTIFGFYLVILRMKDVSNMQ